MLKFFIERPVLSNCISIIILILGLLGIKALPLEQYPDIAPPRIRVTATYPGANAETLLSSVVVPLEEQINGVEGIHTLPLKQPTMALQRFVFFLNPMLIRT